MPRRSKVIPLAAGAAAAATLLALWYQHQADPTQTTASAVEHGTPRAAVEATPAQAVPDAAPRAEPESLTPAEEFAELVAEAERLQALARYPRWSQPLDLLGDALAEQEAPEVQSSDAAIGQPVLTVYTEHRTFEAPEPVTLHARFTVSSGPLLADLTATVFDGTGTLLTELHFSREADGYAAAFVPPALSGANAAYSIRVQALAANQERREALLEIMYNQPYAHLTGNFRDRLDNGDLLIEAEVSVQHAAEFRLNGSLYGALDLQQIAWAEATAKLPAGTSWLPLKFAGLILREQQVDGAYLLRFVALTTHTADAEAGMRPLQNAYTTQPYSADAFEGEAQRDAQWLADAAVLRKHIERMRRQLPADLRAGTRD